MCGRLLAIVLLLIALPGRAELPPGDAERGRLVFGPCRTCHYPEKEVGHNNGPSLWNIFGKRVGSQPGFEYYSDALKRADFVWTPQLMDLWLAEPRKFLPGNNMMSAGVPDPQDRADLIEYLKRFREPRAGSGSEPGAESREPRDGAEPGAGRQGGARF